MTKRSSAGFGQWFIVLITVAAIIFLLFKLYLYGNVRRYLPTRLSVAGVDVGGYTLEEAGQILTDRYISAPVTIYYLDQAIAFNPTQAEFIIDRETMLSHADYQRVQQDFWAGFWGYLWGRPVEVEMVELKATHNREALRRVLNIIAEEVKQPPQAPQPVPATLSFQTGAAGLQVNVDTSLRDVESALYRPFRREAHLVVEPVSSPDPTINMLSLLLTNHLAGFDGVASVFIMDLNTGEEISINANQPMTGMSILKLPIALESMRVLELPLSADHEMLVADTLLGQSGDLSANLLLDIIAGQENAFLGAEILTASMERLGLANTFMVVPFEEQPRPGRPATRQTPANSRPERLTDPDPARQTTAEDMGALLAMLYYCARDGGGALRAVYGDGLTQAECQAIINYMLQNRIGSLIEEGVPADTAVAHRHSWIGETHADAAIVYSPAGDYVIVVFMYKAGWLEWEMSSPLMADISRAAYNYFNFNAPHLGNSRGN
jgi:beta-lactamase class A